GAAGAAALYRLAGSAGNARAQVELARCHLHGRGLPRDVAIARRLFELAARQGDAQASLELARLAQARGDAALARRLACTAADRGEGEAFALLAQQVDERDGDGALAHALLLLARRHGAAGEALERALERHDASDRAQVRRLLARFEAAGEVAALLGAHAAEAPALAQEAPALSVPPPRDPALKKGAAGLVGAALTRMRPRAKPPGNPWSRDR
ncbi:MAG TPA: hypothetical protein VIP05_08820, partial [Burkholderiaceae bacterium]